MLTQANFVLLYLFVAIKLTELIIKSVN
jgi:hypothetical protein